MYECRFVTGKAKGQCVSAVFQLAAVIINMNALAVGLDRNGVDAAILPHYFAVGQKEKKKMPMAAVG